MLFIQLKSNHNKYTRQARSTQLDIIHRLLIDRTNYVRGFFDLLNNKQTGEVVLVPLVEQSLLIPEVSSSIPVIDKILNICLFTCLLSTVLKRRNK